MHEQEILQSGQHSGKEGDDQNSLRPHLEGNENMEARSAIEDISVKSVGNRQQRKK